MSSSTTLVWCTVSTKLESEADPSVVLRRVGPNTKHFVIIHITHSHLTSPTYCEVAGRHVVCVRVLGDPGQVLVLTKDDDGALDRVTGTQAPAEENLGHPDKQSAPCQLVTD